MAGQERGEILLPPLISRIDQLDSTRVSVAHIPLPLLIGGRLSQIGWELPGDFDLLRHQVAQVASALTRAKVTSLEPVSENEGTYLAKGVMIDRVGHEISGDHELTGLDTISREHSLPFILGPQWRSSVIDAVKDDKTQKGIMVGKTFINGNVYNVYYYRIDLAARLARRSSARLAA